MSLSGTDGTGLFSAHGPGRMAVSSTMASVTNDPAEYLERYVRELLEAGAIRSPQVERAFRAAQRHRMVETFYLRRQEFRHDPARPRAEYLGLIYSDEVLATRYEDGFPVSSSSQPSLVAQMLELLDVREGMKVLEIGAGTGYNAALLAELTGAQDLVVTMDIREDVVLQTTRLLAGAGYPGITVLHDDGFAGAPAKAPFQRIVATVGCGDLSPNWTRQLAEDGIMLVPLEHSGEHPLLRIKQDGGMLRGEVAGWTGFMPASGPLHLDELWARGVALASPAPVLDRDAGARVGTGTADETGLLWYLSLTDRRACATPFGPGLSAGFDGWAAVTPDGVQWWKDSALAERVAVLFGEWDTRGRPAPGDYEVRFVPVRDAVPDAAPDAAPGPGEGWQIARRFYRELITLPG
jgi:protein-L-isoaspartate(D-aspartate) O-methyltransferase